MAHKAFIGISQKKKHFIGMLMASTVLAGAVTVVLRPGIVDSIV